MGFIGAGIAEGLTALFAAGGAEAAVGAAAAGGAEVAAGAGGALGVAAGAEAAAGGAAAVAGGGALGGLFSGGVSLGGVAAAGSLGATVYGLTKSTSVPNPGNDASLSADSASATRTLQEQLQSEAAGDTASIMARYGTRLALSGATASPSIVATASGM